MSQIFLPPSSEEQPPAAVAPQHTEPPPHYIPEPLKRPSRFWRVVKWPLRQLLKGIYLLGSAINRHRIISLIGLVALAAMVVGGVLTYRALYPEAAQVSGNTSSASGHTTVPDAPFTLTNSAQVPLSNGVLLWLHGTKTYNAQELWNGMSQEYQASYQSSGSTKADIQKTLDGWHDNGLKFDEFIMAGSFQYPDGTTTYTVEVVVHENDQRGIFTWYFKTDPSGQILSFRDISQA